MLKSYELTQILTGIDDLLSKDWKEFLQLEYEVIDTETLVVNFVEHGKNGFQDNKFLIKVEPLIKGDEHYDKLETWKE